MRGGGGEGRDLGDLRHIPASQTVLKLISLRSFFALGRQFVLSPPVLGNVTKIPDVRMLFEKSLEVFETPLDKSQEFSETL